jgi:predicted metal-dependent RNase
MKISFCGGCEEVGASCLLLQVEGRNLLFDSGIRFGSRDRLPDFRLVQELGGVDAIVLSHAHMDHSGSLPVISREFPRAPIFMTPATRDIVRVLLYDSLKIMDREDEVPAYAQGHVEEMLERIRVYSFQNTFRPFNDREIALTLYQAGHILGAACVYLTSKEGALFYSGDISVTPQRTVSGISFPRLRPDVLVLESTYGQRLHANRKVEEQRLVEIVAEVSENRGKILIPAFALGRAQEVILILRSAINRKQLPPLPVYVDGMVKDILALYRLHPNALRQDLAKRVWREKDVFYSDSVQPVSSPAMRQAIVTGSDPCCIVSSSGMLSGGPSCFYAEQLARGDRNFIAITGYQDEEAPGRQLLDLLETPEGEERVWQLSGAAIPVTCRMGTYGLSAHADRGELLGVVQALGPRRAFLVHGSSTALEELGRALQPLMRGEVYVPRNGERFDIAFKNTHKQLKIETVPPLNKADRPGGKGIQELWAYLVDRPRKAGYTAEELLRIWSGRQDLEEKGVT